MNVNRHNPSSRKSEPSQFHQSRPNAVPSGRLNRSTFPTIDYRLQTNKYRPRYAVCLQIRREKPSLVPIDDIFKFCVRSERDVAVPADRGTSSVPPSGSSNSSPDFFPRRGEERSDAASAAVRPIPRHRRLERLIFKDNAIRARTFFASCGSHATDIPPSRSRKPSSIAATRLTDH